MQPWLHYGTNWWYLVGAGHISNSGRISVALPDVVNQATMSISIVGFPEVPVLVLAWQH